MKQNTLKTSLKKLSFKNFRSLKNLEIEFGTHITVICGKNGTSKSSILGIAAQIFSFEKDYIKDEPLKFKTITGSDFKSYPKEHFRFSDKYDIPGSLDVAVELYDAYSKNSATAELELARRQSIARPVVRKNTSAATGNQSRNFTHPVIFLSLKRLQPIASREYQVCTFDYLNKDNNKQKFINLNNELLNKISSSATETSGSINSAVAHAENYDQDSVSTGEDNAGQIILAIMSFKKLREEYKDYKGGLLLIDEADAGLFPAAQTKLLEILDKECTDLNLQVIMTSHSPSLIERTYELSKKFQKKFKTIYLSDTFGPIKAMHDFSWSDIHSDLHTKTISVSDETRLPKINIYFEDKEGSDLFNTILFRHPTKKIINQLTEVTLGCSNYIQLASKKIPEFSTNSIIILDADAKGSEKIGSIILLPGELPPDQLIFEFLYNLPPSDEIWKNSIKFTKPVFTRCASEIINTFSINDSQVNIKLHIDKFNETKNNESKQKPREIFKKFYKTHDFQQFLDQKGLHNPWKRWVAENNSACKNFIEIFTKRLVKTMVDCHGIDTSKLTFLGNK